MLGALKRGITKQRTAKRIRGAFLALLALLAVATAFGGQASACPPGSKVSEVASVAHKLKLTAHSVDVKGAVISNYSTPTKRQADRSCCGGSHTGANHHAGCCNACTTASVLNAVDANLFIPERTKEFSPTAEIPLASAGQFSRFRPPCIG